MSLSQSSSILKIDIIFAWYSEITATSEAPVYYGAGYIDAGTWCKLGVILSLAYEYREVIAQIDKEMERLG